MDISLENAVLIFDEAHNIGECPWEGDTGACSASSDSIDFTERVLCAQRTNAGTLLFSLTMLTGSSQHSQPAIQLPMQLAVRTAIRGQRKKTAQITPH